MGPFLIAGQGRAIAKCCDEIVVLLYLTYERGSEEEESDPVRGGTSPIGRVYAK
jgi:hypothetical protein